VSSGSGPFHSGCKQSAHHSPKPMVSAANVCLSRRSRLLLLAAAVVTRPLKTTWMEPNSIQRPTCRQWLLAEPSSELEAPRSLPKECFVESEARHSGAYLQRLATWSVLAVAALLALLRQWERLRNHSEQGRPTYVAAALMGERQGRVVDRVSREQAAPQRRRPGGRGRGGEVDEAAQLYFRWMGDYDVLGLENIQLRKGGGVQTVDGPLENVFGVPKVLWLSVEDMDGHTELAKRLLEELWAGPQGDYAPFVQWLRRRDMSTHPLLWEDEEVDWLRPSIAAHAEVKRRRATFRDQLEQLELWATSDTADSPGCLLEDREALLVELRWALCMVWVKALRFAEPSCLALVPLHVDLRLRADLRHTVEHQLLEVPEGEEGVEPGVLGLTVTAVKRLRPGTELLRRADHTAEALLLAHEGFVPGATLRKPNESQLLDASPYGQLRLGVPAVSMSMASQVPYITTKLKILSEYAGIELGPRDERASMDQCSVSLPKELFGTGRLLPLARFLFTQPNEEREIEEVAAMNASFLYFFEQCKLPRYPPNEVETFKGYGQEYFNMELEQLARGLIEDWMKCHVATVIEGMLQIRKEVKQNDTPRRRARGKLAMALLRIENARLKQTIETMSKTTRYLEEAHQLIKDFEKDGQTAEADKATAGVLKYLQHEYSDLSKNAEMYSERNADLLPDSIFAEEGITSGTSSPYYNLPPLMKDDVEEEV